MNRNHLIFRSSYVLMVKAPLNPNITALGEWTDPGKKYTAESSTRDRIVPYNAQNGFLIFLSF